MAVSVICAAHVLLRTWLIYFFLSTASAKDEVSCWDPTDGGSSYRGTVATTETGKTCQAWTSQYPHNHDNTPYGRPNSGLDSNYCRNPDGWTSPWCYTTDPTKRWELCSIPTCTRSCTSGPTNTGSLDRISVTVGGRTCQAWNMQSPHQHTRTSENYPDADLIKNYCRSFDGAALWCYTTDPEVRWELCVIPPCLTECASPANKGTSYRGFVAVTKTGKKCQNWDSQTPHAHENSPKDQPGSGLERNYCRNPDVSDSPWCYTTDPEARWEYCSIPTCTKGCTFETPKNEMAENMNRTVSGTPCQAWSSQSPHAHTRTQDKYPDADLSENYCRNPDGEIGPWCYTTDPEVRWELCVIPPCTNDCWGSDDRGAAYRGSLSVSETRKTCQKWNKQNPHKHTKTKNNYPGTGLDANYCRNPDGEERPWCYTTKTSTRWEYCDIPNCGKGRVMECWSESDEGRSYRGYGSTTVSGRKCQDWNLQEPQEHRLYKPEDMPEAGLDKNYCRNPDEDGDTPWCYTTDEAVRWEYCAIPSCQKGCTMNPRPSAVAHDKLRQTLTGRACQSWNSQSPHKHTKTPRYYPDAELVENYCRNPDGEAGPWCYTTDPDVRWELCMIPGCTTECWNQESKASRYRGTVSTTISGKICQNWDSQSPHSHERTPAKHPNLGLEKNYCRSPDGAAMPWCYTTDKSTRWELCSVPECKSAECMTKSDKGDSYRGTISKTLTGKTCQRWLLQTPHKHDRYPANYPDANLIHNYCRNPKGSDEGPWCYTAEKSTRWEYCKVPQCTVECSNGKDNGATYRGYVSKSKSGRTCQHWSQQFPHEHTRTDANYPGAGLNSNFCRNPDGEARPWCYTMDSKRRWEYCAVRVCRKKRND